MPSFASNGHNTPIATRTTPKMMSNRDIAGTNSTLNGDDGATKIVQLKRQSLPPAASSDKDETPPSECAVVTVS